MQVHRATVHGHFPIYFGEDALDLLLEEVEKVAPDRVFIVTDRTVEELHAEEVRENIPHAFQSELVVFNEGEGNKNLATLEHVAGDLIRAGATERSLVLNLGGGVVLNLGGLAACLTGRGMKFAQIPTTFAAMSGVVNTNRQAIHFIGGRNLLGLFRSPEFVIIDPHFLESEPEAQIIADLVDFARNAMILGGGAYQAALNALSANDLHAQPGLSRILEAAFLQSLELGRIDPSESRIPIFEAYGTSIGRALEALSDGRLSHAEALYYGMHIAAEIARAHGVMSAGEFERHQALLNRIKIRAPFPQHVRTDRLVYMLHGNNKTLADNFSLMLLESIGTPVEGDRGRVTVRDAEIAQAIEKVRHYALL